MVANHLSRLVNEEVTKNKREVREEFPDERVLMVAERPWFVDIANYKVTGVIPQDLNWHQRNKFLHDAHFRKARAYFGIVTIHHMEDIIAETGPQPEYFRLDFSGHPSLKMHILMYFIVINAKE